MGPPNGVSGSRGHLIMGDTQGTRNRHRKPLGSNGWSGDDGVGGDRLRHAGALRLWGIHTKQYKRDPTTAERRSGAVPLPYSAYL
jgi:hypothetical protein